MEAVRLDKKRIEANVVDLVDSSSEDEDVRRSSRVVKKRVINVDGHDILRENNYRVVGDRYVFSTDEGTQQPTKKKAKTTKQLVDQLQHRNKEREPRKISEHEKARQSIQREITQAKAVSAERREAFLAYHLDKVRPFLSSKTISRLEQVRSKGCELIPEIDLDSQPDLVTGGELRDYQLIGLNWLATMHARGLPMILGDEMGLGKTLQTISFLSYLKETLGQLGPSLIVCPLSVASSWKAEFQKWAPSLNVMLLHAPDASERDKLARQFTNSPRSFDAVITTYEMLKVNSTMWSRQHFRYVVFDEGHVLKNTATQVSAAARRLHYHAMLILTGTPLQNNLTELWAILNLMMPKYFEDSEPFDKAFNITENCFDTDAIQKASNVLSLFMIRRFKSEVEKLMPKKIETHVLCPLSEQQLFWYKAILLKDISLLARSDQEQKQGEKVGATRYQVLNNIVMQLRKVCNHPFAFDGAEEDPDKTSLQELVAASGKLAVLDKLLVKLYKKGHRVVLFSQFLNTLDIIEDYVRLRGFQYVRFDGSNSRLQRSVLINRFNHPQSNDFLFLMSTRSGGMGINLQTADTCIIFDSDWNPQADLQAQARVHRIGQKKTVHIYRFLTKGTVEERVVQRSQKKLYLDSLVMKGGSQEEAKKLSSVGTGELLDAIKCGADAIFGGHTDQRLPSDAELEALIDRSPEPSPSNSSSDSSDEDVIQKPDSFDVRKELTSTTSFFGVDFAAVREANKNKASQFGSLGSIGEEWKKQRRERRQRIVMVDGMGSGYGQRAVPVLAINNYDLQTGERSVFDQELKSKMWKGEQKHHHERFQNQDMCQVCGEDSEEMILCDHCPVAMHLRCAGFKKGDKLPQVWACTHHRCTVCNRSHSAAGSMLFRCDACPNSYCEDCVPKGVTYLASLPRHEALAYSTSTACYIHCSDICAKVARDTLGFVPPSKEDRVSKHFDEIDVSFAFQNAHKDKVMQN